MILHNPPQPLEGRTLCFARDVRRFIARLPYSRVNAEDCKQLIRSSGSVGANYLEAQDALSRDDFIYRIKISRKEASESKFWFQLLEENIPDVMKPELKRLFAECEELFSILTAIAKKCDQ